MNDIQGAALTSLHDATLLAVMYEWAQARVTFSLQTEPDVRRDLIVTGVTVLHVTHLEPWGPSESVNQVTWSRREADTLAVLSLEMQSGDLIEARASAFTLTGPLAPRG